MQHLEYTTPPPSILGPPPPSLNEISWQRPRRNSKLSSSTGNETHEKLAQCHENSAKLERDYTIVKSHPRHGQSHNASFAKYVSSFPESETTTLCRKLQQVWACSIAQIPLGDDNVVRVATWPDGPSGIWAYVTQTHWEMPPVISMQLSRSLIHKFPTFKRTSRVLVELYTMIFGITVKNYNNITTAVIRC